MEVAHAVPAELAAIADRAISTSAANRQQSALELGVAIAHGAVDTWGPGWLSRTSVPVLASGPILAAALGESSIPPYRHRAVLHEAPPPLEPRGPVGGGFLPVQMLHPGLRSPAGDAAASSPPADVASSSGPTATPSPSPEILSPPAVSSPVPSSSAPASPVALGSASPRSSDDVAPPSVPVAGSSVPGAGSTDEGGRRWTQRRVVIPLALRRGTDRGSRRGSRRAEQRQRGASEDHGGGQPAPGHARGDLGRGVAGVAGCADGPSTGRVDGVPGNVVGVRWADRGCCDDQGGGIRPGDLDVGVRTRSPSAAAPRDSCRLPRRDGRDGWLGTDR